MHIQYNAGKVISDVYIRFPLTRVAHMATHTMDVPILVGVNTSETFHNMWLLYTWKQLQGKSLVMFVTEAELKSVYFISCVCLYSSLSSQIMSK